ncbi:MAG: hypothetical protein HY052_06460 [Proteobacteria bacterium]|nr:hypothetical protein [Pseudomonadota bacterium]
MPLSARINKRSKKLRVLTASDSKSQRHYLKAVLERSRVNIDVILVDLEENLHHQPDCLPGFLDRLYSQCRVPILFNDSSMATKKLSTTDFGKKLTLKLTSLAARG